MNGSLCAHRSAFGSRPSHFGFTPAPPLPAYASSASASGLVSRLGRILGSLTRNSNIIDAMAKSPWAAFDRGLDAHRRVGAREAGREEKRARLGQRRVFPPSTLCPLLSLAAAYVPWARRVRNNSNEKACFPTTVPYDGRIFGASSCVWTRQVRGSGVFGTVGPKQHRWWLPDRGRVSRFALF